MNLQKNLTKSIEDTSIIIQGKIYHRYKQKTSGTTGETVINVDWGKLEDF